MYVRQEGLQNGRRIAFLCFSLHNIPMKNAVSGEKPAAFLGSPAFYWRIFGERQKLPMGTGSVFRYRGSYLSGLPPADARGYGRRVC